LKILNEVFFKKYIREKKHVARNINISSPHQRDMVEKLIKTA